MTIRLKEGQSVTPETVIARIILDGLEGHDGTEAMDVNSPLPGEVSTIKVSKGAKVKAGDDLLVLSPDKGQVWESLRALYLIGVVEDLPEVEGYARSTQNLPEKIKQQAALTAEAIRKRQ